MDEIRALVNERLQSYLREQRARAAALAPEAPELVDAVTTLTMRGGKRLRPAVLVAAFRAVAPEWHPAEVVDACAALELLQTYLLIHDDWMDGDDERRGGPSVHAALREAHGDTHLGDALAILAGDLACAQAWELLALGGDVPPARRREAIAVFATMQHEVVIGQQLDLIGTADISRMQQLKTGSYTVRGPLLLGAALAGASPPQTASLEAYGAPLGEAFQLRDDLLGTFGDPKQTGKPAGNDLRVGKRTALVRAAEELLDPAALLPLQRVLDGL
ncbi:MAG: polyprenyl synthetase family protein, partial [Sandaracinaceae bacterium]|nr:polyprenyl synthetase family protein [Sandaracinaceae bacterium]